MPTESTGCCPAHKHRNAEEVRNRLKVCFPTLPANTGLMFQSYSLSSQGCGYSTNPEKDRPVQVNAHLMTCTTHRFGNPQQQGPLQTYHRRWKLLQRTHLPAFKDRVRCFVFKVLCWCFGCKRHFEKIDDGSCWYAGMWDAKPVDQEQSEAVFKVPYLKYAN